MFVVTVDEQKCKGCALCIAFCPKKVMELSKDVNKSGQRIACFANPAECVGCKSCGIVCPDDAIRIEKLEAEGELA